MGLAPVCCPPAKSCCAVDARSSGSRAGAVSTGHGTHCTRSVALHPIRRTTPDQKGCHAYGSGAPPPTTSTTAGISSRHTQAAASDAATQPRNTRPAPNKTRYTRSVALHPFRGDTPDPSRYTRSVVLHPIRRDTPDQKGCNAYRSGAPPPTTSTTAGTPSRHTRTGSIRRSHTASTC